jgi:hypothetical protein
MKLSKNKKMHATLQNIKDLDIQKILLVKFI